MKKKLIRMLAIALCLCLTAASALAADATILPEDDRGYRNLISMVTVGDSLYLFTSVGTEAQLYRWTEEMTEAETLATGLLYAEYFSTTEEAAAVIPGLSTDKYADAEHALSFIFTDGEQLYGFNTITNLVFTIEVAEDGLRYADVVTLPCGQAESYYQPIDVIRLGKWILWHETDQNSRTWAGRILAFNIETGTVKQAVISNIQKMTSYKDDLALVICTANNGNGSYAVYTYDPDTDAHGLLGYLPSGMTVSHFDYSAELDMLIYRDSTSVVGWNPENGEEQLGFIPVTYASKLAVVGDSVAYSDTTRVDACTIARGFSAEHSLLILDGNLNAAVRPFNDKYPEVPFYYMYTRDEGSDYEAILARETDAPDIVRLIAGEGAYDKLVEGGCLLDLSAYPAISEYVELLYPAYKELAMENGGIYGLPVYVESYNGWFINKEVMKAMGLTAEDIPTSLTELCAFATRWNDEFAEKYPHYTLLNNTANYRERLLEAILESWTDYCQYSGKEITFDDPIFREALAALDAASLDKLDAGLKQTNPEVSEYKQALIWTGCKDVGNWATYMENYSDRIFIPLTLTPETPYTAAVDHVRLWAVNAKSADAEYAAAMLAEEIAAIDDVHAYILRTDKTEPVISEYYADSLAYEQEKLAALEARLEDSVNRATIEKRIAEQKNYIENELLRSAYTITPSAIENYVNVIAPASFIDMPDGVTDSSRDAEVTGCINRYIKGTFTAEEFITRMNDLLQK